MTTALPDAQMEDTAPLGIDPMPEHLDVLDVVQDRARNLFQYLGALVELRTKMVRDYGSYERVFSVGDLPHEAECRAAAWFDTNGEEPWLRIDKPTKPVLPEPPEECKGWLDPAILVDTSREPVLRTEIIDPESTDARSDLEDEYTESPHLRLDDFPDVVVAWETYVKKQWLPWREEYERWERVQKAYRQLFGIYQLQRRRGEQFELVFGVGTLLWKNDSGHRVRRPAITAQATITLEPQSGSITVGPSAEGARLTLEQDMLEVEERPPVEDQRRYEIQVGELESIWSREQVFEILTSWANTLPVADAEFSDALSCPDEATETPKMVFAPVLMLRKRSGQTLRSAIRKVLNQLQDAATIPPGIREVCGDFSHRHNTDGGDVSPKHFQVPEELLFPLQTNSEQEDIVHRLNGHPGILVQGPPGTGKSHTIANLICHFLAHGKRVLVTSQTPRALKVLHDKLPPRMQALCVSILGSDQGSLRSLQQSVHGILSEVNSWDRRGNENEIQRITQERRACLSEIAHLRRLQREVREAETVEHFVADSPYHGTPQELAKRLDADERVYGWLADDISEDAECPLSSEDLADLAGLRNNLGGDDFALPNYEIPDPESLPSAAAFQREEASLLDATSAVAASGERTQTARVLRLSQVGEETLHRLDDLSQEHCETWNELAACPDSWVRSAVRDMLRGDPHSWSTLHNYTSESLEYLGRFPVDTPLTLQRPPKTDESQLLGDARDLLQHFKSGKGLGFWIFRAPVVKRCQYLWQSYRFNGRLCDSKSALEDLANHLEFLSSLRRIWQEWAEHCNPPSGGLRQHVEVLARCQRLLGPALRLHELAETVRVALVEAHCPTPELSSENWASELLEDLRAARAVRKLTEARSRMDELIAPVLGLGEHTPRHEAANKLIEAVTKPAASDYASALNVLAEVWERRKLAQRCLDLDGRLRADAPELATALEDSCQREALDPHLSNFAEAWGWRRAVSWLRRFLSDSECDLDERIASVEQRLSSATEELVALRAWQSCNEHLNQEHQKQGALQAWQQIMRRIGRGTGKHVETHRRDARKYMDECRDAIPAWIMPLHRVAETIEMKPGAFDIVIVDEASQTGPEGLILQYIGNQCIIVGDDKQISPEPVGINLDAVRSLMEQHLSDFPFAETLAPTSSLFDQAMIRYSGNRVTLREHFRCMPEIIRFSNDLCYSDTPLIPLRQYPPNRLEPVMVRYVVDGYREGQRARVINRPEAAAVVTQVIDCLNDPRYTGKTMGVICLQGHAQAQLVEHLLLDAVGPKPFEERQLVCGDAYSFQGDERDIIFMSMVAATEGPGRIGPMVRETFRQRFNVAASRARDQVWLFHSVRGNELNPNCVRRRLLDWYYNPASEVMSTDLSKCESQFEREVATELVSRRYRVVPQYPCAGKRIDLVVEGTKSRLAIECDGDEWHGADRYEADMQRQRVLERAGWEFARIRGSQFYASRPTEVTRLLDEIEAQGIEPVADRDLEDTDRSYIGEVRGQVCLESLGNANVSDSPDPDGSTTSEPDQDRAADELTTDESAVDTDDKSAEERSKESAGDVEIAEPPDDTSRSGEKRHALPLDQTDAPSIEENATTREQPDERSEKQQTIDMIASRGSEIWLRLSHWGKVSELLEPRERSLAYCVGHRIRQDVEPSFAQAKWARTILLKAMEAGFELSDVNEGDG